jgi:hypothetical protein
MENKKDRPRMRWMNGAVKDLRNLDVRWMNGVAKDLRNLGVVNWKTKLQQCDGSRKF